MSFLQSNYTRMPHTFAGDPKLALCQKMLDDANSTITEAK